MAQPYGIRANPPFRSIAVGAKVQYTLDGGDPVMQADGSVTTWHDIIWYWQPDRDFDGRLDEHPRKKRSYPDKHICEIDYGESAADTDWHITAAVRHGKQMFYVEGPWQKVDYREVALNREITAGVKEGLPNPWLVLGATKKYARVLREVAAVAPAPTKAGREEHDKKLKRLDDMADKLTDLFVPYIHYPIHKLNAVFLDTASQQKVRLRVSLVKLPKVAGESVWVLIDWTDPLDSRLHGTYMGLGSTDANAIQAAIDKWNEKSKYPPGHIRYLVPMEIGRGMDDRLSGFEVGEKGIWARVADFLGIIGTAAAVIAALVAFMVPIPGSQVVSALIWTSVFASSAAAIINITTQDRSWKEDALDGLTIVSNLFRVVGAGARAWARGRTLMAQDRANKVAHYAFIGQVTADSIDGVIATVDIIKDFDAVLSNTSLTPDERVQRLLQILGRGAVQAISIKGTKDDLKNLTLPDGSGTKAIDRLDSLKDPNAPPLDLTTPAKVAGKTDAPTGSTTHVQVDPRKPKPDAPAPKSPPKPSIKPTPDPTANQRGMRGLDHLIFQQVATGKHKLFIVVRDGNPDGVKFMGRKNDLDKHKKPITYEGKPETMKAKTATEGPYKGLVCFDPTHARTHTTLSKLAGYPEITVDALMQGKTPAQLMADPSSEFSKRYHAFKKEKIEAMGYRVIDDDHFIVVHAQTGVRYHGDYDLHAVHYADGKHMDDTTALQAELNDKMGSKMIQHGAHSGWPDRNNPAKAGENAGPMPPVTIYTPDGRVVKISGGSMADMRKRMKRFFLEHNMTWRYDEWEAIPGNKIEPID